MKKVIMLFVIMLTYGALLPKSAVASSAAVSQKKVILILGTSSSGKSRLAGYIQGKLDNRASFVSIDELTGENLGMPREELALFPRKFSIEHIRLYKSIEMEAAKGKPVICDAMLYDIEDLTELFVSLLKSHNYDVHTILVYARPGVLLGNVASRNKKSNSFEHRSPRDVIGQFFDMFIPIGDPSSASVSSDVSVASDASVPRKRIDSISVEEFNDHISQIPDEDGEIAAAVDEFRGKIASSLVEVEDEDEESKGEEYRRQRSSESPVMENYPYDHIIINRGGNISNQYESTYDKIVEWIS
ncbi:MAG: zeta toxin family protein [Oligoflexia bacterium]|nr:zeta toxin family protein [Oligoflexia bacterium]